MFVSSMRSPATEMTAAHGARATTCLSFGNPGSKKNTVSVSGSSEATPFDQTENDEYSPSFAMFSL